MLKTCVFLESQNISSRLVRTDVIHVNTGANAKVVCMTTPTVWHESASGVAYIDVMIMDIARRRLYLGYRYDYGHCSA